MAHITNLNPASKNGKYYFKKLVKQEFSAIAHTKVKRKFKVGDETCWTAYTAIGKISMTEGIIKAIKPTYLVVLDDQGNTWHVGRDNASEVSIFCC
jgi:hypothetical protein